MILCGDLECCFLERLKGCFVVINLCNLVFYFLWYFGSWCLGVSFVRGVINVINNCSNLNWVCVNWLWCFVEFWIIWWGGLRFFCFVRFGECRLSSCIDCWFWWSKFWYIVWICCVVLCKSFWFWWCLVRFVELFFFFFEV